MKKIHFINFLFTLSSCTSVPQFAQTADDIFTDNAVKIEVQRAALERNSDVIVHLEIQDKDTKR